jgi:hypothetical protein
MSEQDPRPLSARLDAYIANLQSIASQMADVRVQVAGLPGIEPTALAEMDNGIKLYRLLADDLTKVLNGEKLQEFRVEGEIGG